MLASESAPTAVIIKKLRQLESIPANPIPIPALTTGPGPSSTKKEAKLFTEDLAKPFEIPARANNMQTI